MIEHIYIYIAYISCKKNFSKTGNVSMLDANSLNHSVSIHYNIFEAFIHFDDLLNLKGGKNDGDQKHILINQ